jgi:hypothetical protein
MIYYAGGKNQKSEVLIGMEITEVLLRTSGGIVV